MYYPRHGFIDRGSQSQQPSCFFSVEDTQSSLASLPEHTTQIEKKVSAILSLLFQQETPSEEEITSLYDSFGIVSIEDPSAWNRVRTIIRGLKNSPILKRDEKELFSPLFIGEGALAERFMQNREELYSLLNIADRANFLMIGTSLAPPTPAFKQKTFFEKQAFNFGNYTKELCLTTMGLTSLPAEIGQLAQVKTLFLFDNQLAAFPEQVCNLTQLEKLCIQNNPFTEFPTEICRLGSLKTLHLDQRQFSNAPEELNNMPCLKKIWVFCKNRSELDMPEWLKTSSKIEAYACEFNPFQPIALNNTAKENSKTFNFITKLWTNRNRPQDTVKLD